ncbi:MAG: hypothetical protein Q8O55_07825 [Dehalococcoidales bacterium]|nr:hypothetical protein [Dehalococcoidales bacterium]
MISLWLDEKAKEIALQETGCQLRELSPHLQLTCYIKAREMNLEYWMEQEERDEVRSYLMIPAKINSG